MSCRLKIMGSWQFTMKGIGFEIEKVNLDRYQIIDRYTDAYEEGKKWVGST